MKACSLEVRELVVGAVVARGWTWARAAETYGVSLASVGRFVGAFRAGETSLAACQPSGGRPPKLRLAEQVAALREHLEAQPDLDLAARCGHLQAHAGVQVSAPTLWRAWLSQRAHALAGVAQRAHALAGVAQRAHALAGVAQRAHALAGVAQRAHALAGVAQRAHALAGVAQRAHALAGVAQRAHALAGVAQRAHALAGVAQRAHALAGVAQRAHALAGVAQRAHALAGVAQRAHALAGVAQRAHALAGVARPGLHAKKDAAAREQDPVERAAWRWQTTRLLHATDLVFVDESGANRARCPRYGDAPKGQRSLGQAPRNRGRNTSVLAAMSPAGLLGTMTVEGSTNTDVFLTDLDQVLCPALRPGQTVVMDNLSVHKNDAVRQKIEAAGCRRWFLPAYRPDFHPIEHAFAKLKNFLRKAKARTQETLEAAIAAGLATLSAQAACGWCKHCEFPLNTQSF